MKRLAGSLVAAIVASVCAAALTLGVAAPAAALLGFPCPPGAAPGSTVCSPAGWIALTGGLPAGYAAGGAGVATATAAASGASAGSAAITAGSTVLVGLGTWGAFELLVDPAETDLEIVSAPTSAAWIPGPYLGIVVSGWSEEVVVSSTQVLGSYEFVATTTPAVAAGSGTSQRGFGVGFQVTCRNTTSGVFSVYGETQGVQGNLTWGGSVRTYERSGTINRTCPAGSVLDRVDYYQYETRISPSPSVTWENLAGQYGVDPTPRFVGTLEAEFVCRSGSGDTNHLVSTPVDVAAVDTVNIDMPEFNCPPGETLVHGIIEWVTDAGRQTVYEYDAPEWVQDIPTEWPNCADGSCTLSLWQVLSPTKIVGCGQYAVGCPEWWQDPYKADNYECHYGAYVVQLGMCSVFRNPGKVSPNVTTTTEPDGSIKTGAPNFSEDPDDYPSEGIDPDPPVPPWPIPDPIPDPVEDGSMACWPTGWAAFNPLNWVYQPVRCALVWAFVPRQEVVQTQLQTVREDVVSKPPFAIIDAGVPMVQGLFDGYTSGTCGFGNFWPGGTEELTIECATPDGWEPVYGIAVVAIWAGSLWQGVRMVAAGIGNREAG